MTNLEAAWLAGLVDGEGAIWCRWPKRPNVVLEIKMASLPTLQEVNSLFPGRLVKGCLSSASFSAKPQWRWSLDTRGTQKLLYRINPYMVTKKQAAIAALHLCRRPVDPKKMDAWAAVLRSLNG